MTAGTVASRRDVEGWLDESPSSLSSSHSCSDRVGLDGFPFPAKINMLSVRWYLRYGLSYRDLEELLAERNIGLIMSRCIGGFNASHLSWLTQHDQVATRSETAGSSMKRM